MEARQFLTYHPSEYITHRKIRINGRGNNLRAYLSPILVTCSMLAASSTAFADAPVKAHTMRVWYGINDAGNRVFGSKYIDGSYQGAGSYRWQGFDYGLVSFTAKGEWVETWPGSLLLNRWVVFPGVPYDAGDYLNTQGQIVNIGWRSIAAYPETSIKYYYDKLYQTLPLGSMNSQGNDNDAWSVNYTNQTRAPITLYRNDTRTQAWTGNAGPAQIIINPCSEVTVNYLRTNLEDFSSTAYTTGGHWFNSGAIIYNVRGSYIGTLDLLSNWAQLPRNSKAIAQGASGSSDWIAVEGAGISLCGVNQQYNCVVPVFTSPKNIAASPYSGGHGNSLRRYSSKFSQSNNGVVIFKARSSSDRCGLTEQGFVGYLSQQVPLAIAAHPDQFMLSNGDTFEHNYPKVGKQSLRSAGMYVKDWGLNGLHGLPSFKVDPATVTVITSQASPGSVESIFSSYNTFINTTNMLQTLQSSSFSKSITNTSTSTSTDTWADQVGGSIGVESSAEAKVPFVGSVTFKVNMNVNYSHNRSHSDSESASHSETQTITAPPQAISLAPKHYAKVYWKLGRGNAVLNYSFSASLADDTALTGEMGGRLVATEDEWLHPGDYQAFNSDMVLVTPTRFTTSLYTLLRPDYGIALPSGLIWDEKQKKFMLHGQGTAKVQGVATLEVVVETGELTKDGKPDYSKPTKTTSHPVAIH